MISDERQYHNTKRWLERFEQTFAEVDDTRRELDPRARRALREQYRSQIEELRAELAAYEALGIGQKAQSEKDRHQHQQPGHAVSLAGVLTRLGLTLNDLADYLRIPPSVALKLQRGRIEPKTLNETLLAQLGAFLRLDVEEVTRLLAARSPVPRLSHLRHAGVGSNKRDDDNDTQYERVGEAEEDELMPFHDALTSAPDLTEIHARAWLMSEETKEQ